MGNCVSNRKQKNVQSARKQFQRLQKLYNPKQLQLLRLIYNDISSRSPNGQLSRQNFLLFFHKNGYWGQRLFKEFEAQANAITQQQFIKGIMKIFKTSEEKKIELLFRFFSDKSQGNGISFNNFLKMLYNYPKEDLKEILNDPQFINQELKKNLVSIENQMLGRRLISLSPMDLRSNAVNNKAFRLEEAESNSDKVQSKYGAKIIQELNKHTNQKKDTVSLMVGENYVEIKTTSVHQLVKKFARSIFQHYGIDLNTGRFSYQNFKDWIMHHKNLFNDFYKGFHSEVWEVDKVTNKPVYLDLQMEYTSKARAYVNNNVLKVVISLYHSILIIRSEGETEDQIPLSLICLEGLAANPIFDNDKGHGIELTHREGIYGKKVFYVQNEEIQKSWMQYLKFYKGTSINQVYEIKEQIGAGKFSVVYNCVQKSTNENFAIKVIESFKLDDQAKRIIAHESSIMSVMSHPLLVFFKESIATKTHIYIVTELVKGKDLFDFVKQSKFLGEVEAAYIFQQILIGVRYIHSLGIVHRDLKPENIMLQYEQKNNTIGRIKIIDFGFANYLSSLREMTREELWAGTPNYIAPQILREDPFSEKIDNFAIGSILYYMLSGNLPFNSPDINLIIQKTLESSFSLNSRRWNEVSVQAKDLITKLLQNQPSKRISLDNALNHPWLTRNRKNRVCIQNGTALKLSSRNDKASQKSKSTAASAGTALIY